MEDNKLTKNHCTTETDQSRVVVKENKSQFIVINERREKLRKTQVDGCLFDQKYQKCDWIISTNNNIKKAFYIELKGCDLDKAISQLVSTLSLTFSDYSEHYRQCFIVTTRIPKYGPSVQKKCKKFHHDNSCSLTVKNIKNEVTI